MTFSGLKREKFYNEVDIQKSTSLTMGEGLEKANWRQGIWLDNIGDEEMGEQIRR